VTVVAAASSGVRVGRALPALVLGSSLFLQAHLLLGYVLGPAARELMERARLPVLLVAAVALVAVATLLLRRRRTRATRVLAEGPARPAWPSACSALVKDRPEARVEVRALTRVEVKPEAQVEVSRDPGRGPARAKQSRPVAGSPGGGA
jgi:hypothetical protein